MAKETELSMAAIALNRFGLGARPGDTPPGDPKGWLKAQYGRFEFKPAAFAALPDPNLAFNAYREQQKAQRMQPAKTEASMALLKDARRDIQALYREAVNARAASALATEAPFVERLVHFWSNHFAISAEKPQVNAMAGDFEMIAIRPHVLGRFEDMLVAVAQHPAMLFFLDQVRSAGPESMMATRAAARNANRKLGLNENLAREIMELHTLGVRSGYGQADVTEFARALTGWSVADDGPKRGATPGQATLSYQFRPGMHEPGVRTILGKKYDQQGQAQARAVLHDLATAPATAKHVATKLARHFAGDTPPPALVDRLAAAFSRSGGDLKAVYAALIDSPEAWSPAPAKFKSPWEWTVSSLRGVGRKTVDKMQVAPLLVQLGQPVWRPGSPAGWDDIAQSWAGPDALVRRVEVAQRFATSIGDRMDPGTLAASLLPGEMAPATATEIGRAESVPTAIALLLVSPDFQRR